MKDRYDLMVFIGRFQPFHAGHMDVIISAANKAKRVLVLVGSSHQPRTIKNPFTFEERKQMIEASVRARNPDLSSRLSIQPLHDHMYSDQQWATEVQQHVYAEVSTRKGDEFASIAVIGHTKDDSSYYLKMFPQWDLVEHDINEVIHATDIRSLIFEGKSAKFLVDAVPSGAINTVKEMLNPEGKLYDEYCLLRKEHDMINRYKQAWKAAPYAPTFVTTDAVVVQSGHVCLVQRKAAPGENLWALPGGFLEQTERIEDGAIRELIEETRIKVPAKVLRGNIKSWQVFDHPNRSLRGRTITHAALIELPPGPLPAIKGCDDAKQAKWVPIADVVEEMMFEDHYHIVQTMIGRL